MITNKELHKSMDRNKIKVGTVIRIIHLEGENEDYDGRQGTVEYIDDMGDLHGTWGGLAVIPEKDEFKVLKW